MKIHHIGIWTNNLMNLKAFYSGYFGAKPGEKYENKTKGFSSFFLTFDNGSKIELMELNTRLRVNETDDSRAGLSHIAISVGSREKVDSLTSKLMEDGIKILSLPRVTGDGYYESLILDPDGNRIEITE